MTGIARVYLLHRFGGVWLDADVIVLNDFSAISSKLESYQFVGSENGNDGITNAFMGARPDSDFMRRYWSRVSSRLDEGLNLSWGEVGTQLLKRIYREHQEGCYIFPVGTLVTFSAAERHRFFEETEELDTVLRADAQASTLYNNSIDLFFRSLSDADILNGDWTLSKIFRRALRITGGNPDSLDRPTVVD